MISHNRHSNCTNARSYYYDFLSEQTQRGIPETTLDHIAHCCDCQAEIDRLEMTLAHAEQSTEREQSRKDSAVSALLKLHFAYLAEPVKCSAVKPFLPSLADPALRIRIRTPITRHLEECRACSGALMSLRDLHLSHKQLCHLGQLLADEPTGGEVSCSQARAAIPAVVSMTFHQTSAGILKHVCVCPDCRRQLYLRREAVRQKLLRGEAPQDTFSCDAVSASDIYDYALPYGLDPANDQYAESRKPLAAHLQNCPTCLARMQELHRMVCGIAEQAESGVVTVHHLDEPAQVQPPSPTSQASGPRFEGGMPSRRTSTPNARPLLKAGAIAAAALIGLALLLNAPTVRAVTLDQVYRAVEKVRGVYLATFAGYGTEPTQERWMSKGLNTYLVKTGSLCVLSDIGAGVTKSRDSRTGVLKEVKLTEDDIVSFTKTMNLTLAFMPFQRISDVPADAQWTSATDANHQANTEGTAVYDLAWTERTYGGVVHNKWRAFVDPQTSLPRRVEFYQKQSADAQYDLTSVREIKYMTDAEIEAVIDGFSF